MNAITLDQFDIRNFTDRLTPTKRGKYECPVCGGNDFAIDPKSGAYNCFNAGCAPADIREAVRPLSEALAEVRGDSSYTPRPISRSNLLESRPVPLPEPIELVKHIDAPKFSKPLPCNVPDSVQKEITETGCDAATCTEQKFAYSERQWISRYQWVDPSKSKGYSKTFRQWHLDSQGRIKSGKGDQPWALYRESESVASAAGKWVIWSEGEGVVDAFCWLGFPAVTAQGSSWNRELEGAVSRLKQAGIAGITCFSDNDPTGEEKARKLEQACAKAGMPIVSIDPLALWSEMPEHGDVVDWLRWGRQNGMERSDFIRRIEEEIHAAAAARRAKDKADSPVERLRAELKLLSQETDPIEYLVKKQEICSTFRIKGAEVESAVANLKRQFSTPKTKRMTLDDLLGMESEGTKYVIPGLLPAGETVLLSGMPKSGKTLLALDAAFAIATGESDFLGERVEQGRVLLVSVDESARSTRTKLVKRGFRSGDEIEILTDWDIDRLGDLEGILESFRPTVTIVDSLKRITSGYNISENSAEFADNIYRLKELLTRYNSAGILLHHSNKDREATGIGKVRGSTAIAGAVWGIWQLDVPLQTEGEGKSKKATFDPASPDRILTVIPRDCEGQTLNIRFDAGDNSWVMKEEESEKAREQKSLQQQILEILSRCPEKGMEAIEIRNLLGDNRSVYTVLNRMVDRAILTCRPSKVDRRRMVFCLPFFLSEKSGFPDQLAHTLALENIPYPPPPTVSPTDPSLKAETLSPHGFEVSQQIVNSSSTVGGVLTNLQSVTNSSNLYSARNTEIVNTPTLQGGGGGETKKVSHSLIEANPLPDELMAIVEMLKEFVGSGLLDRDAMQELTGNLTAEQKALVWANLDSQNRSQLKAIQQSPEKAEEATEPIKAHQSLDRPLKIGDKVAGANPEATIHKWHGQIKGFKENGFVRVWWQERANSENKRVRKTPELSHRPEDLRRI